jgi:hypothetical protein
MVERLDAVRSRLLKSAFDENAYIRSSFIDEPLRPPSDEDVASSEEQQLLSKFDTMTADLVEFSSVLETDIVTLQKAVDAADDVLRRDLDHHERRLDAVKGYLGDVLTKFDVAASGAVRLGSKLATIEKERARIEAAMETMALVRAFEAAPLAAYAELVGMEGKLIRAALPEPLCSKDKTWGDVSLALYELRRLLVDINAADVQNAQANVLRASEAVEGEMLAQFERAVAGLMADVGNQRLLKKARNLALWLHYYGDGQVRCCCHVHTIPHHHHLKGDCAALRRRCILHIGRPCTSGTSTAWWSGAYRASSSAENRCPIRAPSAPSPIRAPSEPHPSPIRAPSEPHPIPISAII